MGGIPRETGEGNTANSRIPPAGYSLPHGAHFTYSKLPEALPSGATETQRLALFSVAVDGLDGGTPERLVGGLPTEDPARGAQADHYGSALAVCDGFLYLSIGDTDSPGPGRYRPGGIRFVPIR